MLNVIFGFLSGIISGMGIGGGAILIPFLTLLANLSQKTAQGINLTYFIPTAIIAVAVHIKNKTIRLSQVVAMGVSGIPGAVLGATVANAVVSQLLRRLFVIFLLLVGLYEIYKGVKSTKPDILKKPSP